MKINFRSIFLLTIMTGVFMGACNKDDGTDKNENNEPIVTEIGEALGDAVEMEVGPDGGTVISADGLLNVIIPSGALTTTTNIKLQPISNNAPLGIGTGYRLEPEGLTFSVPVTLQFNYTQEQLNSSPEDFLWIVTQAENGTWNALLKCETDTINNTVTIETSHFSDWSLGRFVDLKLAPVGASVSVGKNVSFVVAGFSRGESTADDELAPLIPVTDDDELVPLTPINSIENKLAKIKVVKWTQNGVNAPVSNNYGSLAVNKNTATYTAPNTVPKQNVIAITAELALIDNDNREKGHYYVTSNVTVIDNDLYFKFVLNGTTHMFYQPGIDGNIVDPDNFATVNPVYAENILNIVCLETVGGAFSNGLGISIVNPVLGSKSLIGFMDGGEDEFEYIDYISVLDYKMLKTIRTHNGNSCDVEDVNSYLVSITLTEFTPEMSYSEISGSFSGKLYRDEPNFGNDCISSEEYPISGDFHLILLSAPN